MPTNKTSLHIKDTNRHTCIRTRYTRVVISEHMFDSMQSCKPLEINTSLNNATP